MSQDPPTAWEQEHMPILQSFNYVGRHTQIVLELYVAIGSWGYQTGIRWWRPFRLCRVLVEKYLLYIYVITSLLRAQLMLVFLTIS